jgi:prepilin-type N-terminal cleavage/methylation domain-containing protein
MNLKFQNSKSKNHWRPGIGDWKLVRGFTLVELLVSMGILALIFGLSSVNISQLPSNTVQSTNLDTLKSDIRSQQTLSMSNDSSYGVHFESNSYTLFKGDSYTQGLNANTVISLDSGIVFTNTTFSNSVVVFSPGTGDVSNYLAGSDGFTIKSSGTNQATVVKINKYGATY